jgi:hypothetical protein
MSDPYAMDVTNLRRRSQAVYLACEEPVAKDISESLRWAAARIEALEAALRDLAAAALRDLAEWCAVERAMIGAVDGYDYRSGEEYGLRRAEIEITKRTAALAPEQNK